LACRTTSPKQPPWTVPGRGGSSVRSTSPWRSPAWRIVGILAFNFHWNEFFRPLILTISEQNFTLPLGLVTLQGNLATGSISVVLASLKNSMLPALVVFIFGQRTRREGLTAGASK